MTTVNPDVDDLDDLGYRVAQVDVQLEELALQTLGLLDQIRTVRVALLAVTP